MNLKIGIIGLPNVGKSTLFNALIRGAKAEVANYPFCTIEPNVGVVEVPDMRLKPLSTVSKSQKTIPAVVEFVDIAGLVRGANKGEGLGNQFLAHIRECNAIAQVVRFFKDENIVHVEGKINPINDVETVNLELQLADIATVEKRLFAIDKELKTGSKASITAHKALQKIKVLLHNGKNAREADLNEEELREIKSLNLLTIKPILYIANCSEEQLAKISNYKDNSRLFSKDLFAFFENQNSMNKDARGEIKKAEVAVDDFIPISAKVEQELNDLTESDRNEYLKSLGFLESGLDRLIKSAYKILGLITYFTSGEKETRAWTIIAGYTAPQAAGVIHTDLQRGFIAAEVAGWLDLVNHGGWTGARAKGLVRTEGKNYILEDGDTCLFRFNV